MQLTNNSLLWIGFLICVLQSCSPIKNVRVDERFGKRIAYIHEGEGSPTILFESGFESGMETWGGLIDSLSQHTQVFAYNRPGYGRSNKKNPPACVREVAEHLHANLSAKRIKPPYILVGHSEGALMINMFARLYPDEVVGVLMIEPTHPDLYDYLNVNENLIYDVLIDYVRRSQRRYEFDLIQSFSEEFKSAPDFPDVELTILMAGKHPILESEQLREKTLEFHEDLKSMSSVGTRYLIEDSGHLIHRQKPDLIITEILRWINLP